LVLQIVLLPKISVDTSLLGADEIIGFWCEIVVALISWLNLGMSVPLLLSKVKGVEPTIRTIIIYVQ